MPHELKAKVLTTNHVAPDGSTVSLCFEDAKGEPGAMTLPTSCVQQLVMTLPHLLSEALRAQHGDDTLRAVFPLGAWHLEAEAGTSTLILTLMTTDGFEVAFSLKPPAMGKMMSAIDDARSGVGSPRRPLSS